MNNGNSRILLGMLLFIASESIFFLILLMTYINFQKTGDTAIAGVSATAMLDPLKTGLFSVALFSSSLTMWLAERSRERGQSSGRWWLFATIALGATFLVGQALEWSELLRNHLTINRNLFGSAFFTLTGFHGLHVFIGLLLLCMLFWLSFSGRKHEPPLGGMQCISLYWHFVDAVWVVIFSAIYLWRYV